MPDENSRRHIQHAVVRIQLLNRGTTAGGIPLAKNLLKVAVQEFVNSLRHGPSPQHLLSAVIDSRTAREPLRYGSKPFSGIHLLGVWCGWQRGGWEPIRAFLYLLPGRSRALERGAALTGARHLAGGDPCDLCSS